MHSRTSSKKPLNAFMFPSRCAAALAFGVLSHRFLRAKGRSPLRGALAFGVLSYRFLRAKGRSETAEYKHRCAGRLPSASYRTVSFARKGAQKLPSANNFA